MTQYALFQKEEFQETCPSCNKREGLKMRLRDMESSSGVKCKYCYARIKFDSGTIRAITSNLKKLIKSEEEFFEVWDSKFKSISIEKK